MQAALFFSQQLLEISYGAGHPFEVERLADVLRLCRALDLLPWEGSPLEPAEADRSEITRFHLPAYIDALEHADSLPIRELAAYGVGFGDNPFFPGLWRSCKLIAGGSLSAAKWLIAGGPDLGSRRVFHPGGGLHHARKDRASGFCYVNDPVLAIQEIAASGARVCYVDVDAHHGDGVQEAFYELDTVLTISIHQDGRTIFPGTGFPNEIGRGRGAGYSVNVPLLPGAMDDEYDFFRTEILQPIVDAFDPDVLVTQIGVDSLRDDPLALMNWTLSGLDRFLLWADGTGLPWLALGGGGYRRWNVVRGWSLVWARMLGRTLPRDRPVGTETPLPASWPVHLWDEPPPREMTSDTARRTHLEQVAAVIREMVLSRLQA